MCLTLPPIPLAVSCPGDYCFYDPNTLEQICTHCCHATHAHVDGENYTIAERKVRANQLRCGLPHSPTTGDSGPGSVRLRAPGRITRVVRRVWAMPVRPAVHHRRLQRRCVASLAYGGRRRSLAHTSTAVDCPYDCAGHGVCSVEYPVSRCLCDPGWEGETCDTGAAAAATLATAPPSCQGAASRFAGEPCA